MEENPQEFNGGKPSAQDSHIIQHLVSHVLKRYIV